MYNDETKHEKQEIVYNIIYSIIQSIFKQYSIDKINMFLINKSNLIESKSMKTIIKSAFEKEVFMESTANLMFSYETSKEDYENSNFFLIVKKIIHIIYSVNYSQLKRIYSIIKNIKNIVSNNEKEKEKEVNITNNTNLTLMTNTNLSFKSMSNQSNQSNLTNNLIVTKNDKKNKNKSYSIEIEKLKIEFLNRKLQMKSISDNSSSGIMNFNSFEKETEKEKEHFQYNHNLIYKDNKLNKNQTFHKDIINNIDYYENNNNTNEVRQTTNRKEENKRQLQNVTFNKNSYDNNMIINLNSTNSIIGNIYKNENESILKINHILHEKNEIERKNQCHNFNENGKNEIRKSSFCSNISDRISMKKFSFDPIKIDIVNSNISIKKEHKEE